MALALFRPLWKVQWFGCCFHFLSLLLCGALISFLVWVRRLQTITQGVWGSRKQRASRDAWLCGIVAKGLHIKAQSVAEDLATNGSAQYIKGRKGKTFIISMELLTLTTLCVCFDFRSIRSRPKIWSNVLLYVCYTSISIVLAVMSRGSFWLSAQRFATHSVHLFHTGDIDLL